MVPAGNKAKRLSSVNHTITIHQFIVRVILDSFERPKTTSSILKNYKTKF